MSYSTVIQHILFQSTLSARRATKFGKDKSDTFIISIHALREESDWLCFILYAKFNLYFNPRSPRGERREPVDNSVMVERFQSTLSARRATYLIFGILFIIQFQSTLSARRATVYPDLFSKYSRISIHALREESDAHHFSTCATLSAFQSTLSARRAT